MRVLLSLFLLTMTAPTMSETAEQLTIDKMVEDARARTVIIAERNPDGSYKTSVAGDLSGVAATDAVFEIGSISKVFTSLLIERLVTEGKVEWTTTVREALPDVVFGSDEVAAITLIELSTHTSGLPRLPDNMVVVDPMDPYANYAREDLVAWLEAYSPDKLDKSYEYSNLGAGMLGLIAGELAGTSYADAMHEYVLEPIGMTDSAVGLQDRQLPRLVAGFSDGADMANWSGFDALAGAGAITSTVADMSKFVDAHFRDSPIRGSLAAIMEPQGNGETAFGWHIEPHPEGDALLWHNGGTGGYASYLSIRLADQTATIVLSASTEYGAITELGMGLSKGVQADTSLELDAYAGVFQIAEGFYLTVYADGGRLYTQATGQGALVLDHLRDDVFVFEAADIRLDFNRDPDGTVPSIDYTQGGRAMTISRVDDSLGIQRHSEIDVSEETLDEYEGEYQLAPGAVFTIFHRGDQLFAQLTGQPAYPVFAHEVDGFFYKVVDARLRFERATDGTVEALVLIQGREQRAPRITK